MKLYYEVYLMQHVKGSVEDDFETRHIESYGKNYNEHRKIAKEFSSHIGEEMVEDYMFDETDHLDKGLAAVDLVCYTLTEETGYNIVHRELFENGRGLGRE